VQSHQALFGEWSQCSL